MKRLISCILVSIIIFSLYAMPVSAETAWDPNAGGGGDTGNVSGGTFQTEYTGFRVTLFNGNELFYPDNSCVDVLFTNPADRTGKVIYNKANKIGNAETTILIDNFIYSGSWPEISDMPTPIGWDSASSSFVANGERIRSYLMDGEGGTVFDPRPTPIYPDTPSNGGSSGSSNGSSSGGTNNTPENQDRNSFGLTPYQQRLCDEIVKIYNAKISNYATATINMLRSAISYYENGYLGPVAVPAPQVSEFTKILNNYLVEARQLTSEMSVYEPVMATYINNVLGARIRAFTTTYSGAYAQLQQCLGVHIIPTADTSFSNEIKFEDIAIPLASTKNKDDNNSGKKPRMDPFLKACFEGFHPDVLEDIKESEQPLVLIEAIVWYRPVRMNKTVEPYWVYGTGKNIAQFNIQNAQAMGNDHGALMQKLTNEALPLCMVLDKDEPTLEILKPYVSNKFIPSQSMQ